jgi:hypothetical protein
MTKWMILGLALFTAAMAFAPSAADAGGSHYVRPHYRRDGTYVQGHRRTNPDGIKSNNYSYPGNYNPNTGQITGGSTHTLPYYAPAPPAPPPPPAMVPPVDVEWRLYRLTACENWFDKYPAAFAKCVADIDPGKGR